MIEQGNKLLIRKKFFSKSDADQENNFINQLDSKKNKIVRLLSFRRINDLEIEYPFLSGKNLWLELKEGKFSKEEFIGVFELIKKGLDDLYGNKERCLIHGDLFPINIYRHKNIFYLIDYNDCHIYDPKYDQFILLKSMISTFYQKDVPEIMSKYFTKDEIVKFNKHKKSLDQKKYAAND